MDFNFSKMKKIGKWLIGVVAVCILIFLGVNNIGVIADSISWVLGLFGPLILGLIIAIILNVPMGFFERILWPRSTKKFLTAIRRPLAFILSLVMILGIITGIIILVIPELTKAVTIIANSALEFVKELSDKDKNSELHKFINKMLADVDWDNITVSIQNWLADSGSGLMNTAVGTVTAVFGGLIDVVFAIIFSVYILFSKRTLKAQSVRMARAWLPEGFAKWLIHASKVALRVLRNFISGQTMEAFIIGSLCMLGMFILGIPYAPVVGVFVGMTALIPVVGSFIGAGVGAFMIVTVSPIKALVFLIFLIVLQQVEGNIVYPRVMGARVKLPALWILVAVTVGGNLAGPAGMLFGVPVASTTYVLLREATEAREKKKKTAELLDEENEIIESDD